MNVERDNHPEIKIQDTPHATLPSRILRIAIVDDNRIVRSILQTVIEDTPGLTLAWGAVCLTDAAAWLDNDCPDLLILDVMLPDGNGFQFARQVSASHPDLPILMVSSDPNPENPDRARECGARAFISKNVHPSVLLDKIFAILD